VPAVTERLLGKDAPVRRKDWVKRDAVQIADVQADGVVLVESAVAVGILEGDLVGNPRLQRIVPGAGDAHGPDKRRPIEQEACGATVGLEEDDVDVWRIVFAAVPCGPEPFGGALEGLAVADQHHARGALPDGLRGVIANRAGRVLGGGAVPDRRDTGLAVEQV